MDFVILLACLISTGASTYTLWFLKSIVKKGLVKPDQRAIISRLASGEGKHKPGVKVP